MNKINKQKIIISSILLLLFLLTLPYLIIPLTFTSFPFSKLITSILAFIYASSSCLISISHYSKLSKLENDKIKNFLLTFWSGITVIFTYFFSAIIQSLPLLLINPNIAQIPLIIKTIYLSIFEICQVTFISFLLKEQIKPAIKDIKKNYKNCFVNCAKYYLLAITIMMISNLFISTINSGNIAGNEEAIRETLAKAPIYMYFSAVIIAPLLEELVFRQAIRNIFTNNKLFIIMSGLIFGGLHVIGNINTPIDILYLIPYSIPGFAFAYMLTKTNNIFVSTGFHFLHNAITISLQVLLMILGA